MHRFHVHHHHTFDPGRGERRGPGPGDERGRARRRRRGPRFDLWFDGSFDERFSAGLDRQLDRVIATLEERQRDLEQAAADLADTVRRLKERRAGEAAGSTDTPPAEPGPAPAG